MWDVVIWSDQAAIDFVPSSWANEDNKLYKYPTNLSETKIRELIYESRNITQNFIWCEAKLKKKNVRTLDRAKEICRMGQFTSTIESSDASEEDTFMHRRKKTRRLIEECDIDASLGRGRPHSEQDSQDEMPAVPKKKFSFPSSSNSGIERDAAEETNISRNSPVVLSQHNKLLNSVTTDRVYRSVSTPTSPAVHKTTSTDNFGETVRKILKNQAEIQFDLKEVRKKLENIENRLLNSEKAAVLKENEDPEMFVDKLPMKTVQDCEEMEEIISDKNSFNNLTNILFLIGGGTVQKSIYSIMKKMFTNELAQKYSGQGKKQKLPFCSLKVYRAVKNAARKRHSTATDEEVKKMVALFLAQSKARASISRKRLSAHDDDDLNN